MNYKELETLGYTSHEIEELQNLGIAELVVDAHARMETVAEEKEVVTGAPRWATAAFALVSAVLLASPWAAEISGSVNYFVENSRKEAHRELLREAFKNNEKYLEIEGSPNPDNPSYRNDSGCLVSRYVRKSFFNCVDGTYWHDPGINQWIEDLEDK